MSEKTKTILAAIGLIVLLVIIFNLGKWFGKKNRTTTGTGTNLRRFQVGGGIGLGGGYRGETRPLPSDPNVVRDPIVNPNAKQGKQGSVLCHQPTNSPPHINGVPTGAPATQPVCEQHHPFYPKSFLISSTPVPANSGGNSGFVEGSLATKCCYGGVGSNI